MGEVLNVIVAFAVIVFAVRWVTKAKDQPNSPGAILGFRPRNVTDEMVNSIHTMFPDIPRPNIHYSLLRTGSVQVTSNTILERGFLDAPPPAYYTLYTQQQQQQQQQPLPVPQPAARSDPAPAKKQNESLVQRFRLENRVKEDTTTEPERAGGKAIWETTSEAREKSLQERKAQMILAARRRWLEQQQKAPPGSGPSSSSLTQL